MSLPKELESEVVSAIEHLRPLLRCNVCGCETHKAIEVLGWNDSDATRTSVAKYLVGLRASAIDAALNIRAELVDSQEDRLELVQNVDQILNSDKTTARNPWIAEGMWHLCLVLSKVRNEIHPLGKLIALNPAHPIAKDHGLDIVGIFETANSIGLSIVECKAYSADPNKAINEAVAFYEEIDSGKHAVRIRQAIQNMRAALTSDKQQFVTASFWKHTRAYLPNPHYSSTIDMKWDRVRPSLKKLFPGKDAIVIMPHAIGDFDKFFDSIAAQMHSFTRSL